MTSVEVSQPVIIRPSNAAVWGDASTSATSLKAVRPSVVDTNSQRAFHLIAKLYRV